MKKISASILSAIMMLSMIFSSSVFAANDQTQTSAWDSFVGLFTKATTAGTMGVEYAGWVQDVGQTPTDGSYITGPERLGTPGLSRRLEGFQIKLTGTIPTGASIKYIVHVQDYGWMGNIDDTTTWKANGTYAGTKDESKRIEDIKIVLVGADGKTLPGYSVSYKGHVENEGDTAWVSDGASFNNTGKSQRLECLEVKITQTKADMTAYNAAVAQANSAKAADYTTASYKALTDAVAANVVTDADTQAKVDAAAKAINDAYAGLVKAADLDAYNAAVAQAGTAKAADYTTASYKALTDAVAANVVTKDDTQAKVDAAAKAINDAYAALVKAADLTAYNAAVTKANAVVKADYTDASYAALTKALADNVVTKDNTAAEVKTATDAITAATDALVKVANMDAYNEAVTKAKAAVKADYTADTYAALEKALADNVVTNQDTQAKVDEATAAINGAYDGLVLLTKIDNATATAKDKITVTFNQAIDTATDKLTVKKASVNVNLDGITYSDDKKSAIIDTTSNLTKGDYTITLVAANNTSTKVLTAADEKVSSIVLKTETAPLNTASSTVIGNKTYSANCSVFATYQVLNQYGEKMVVSSGITWSASTGGNITNNYPTATTDGSLVIGNYAEGTQFIPNATLYLTAVHPSSATVLNGSVTVGLESKADKAVFKGIYDKTTGKVIDTLPAGFANSRYDILYEVNDQYGNKIASPTVTQLTMLSTNPIFIVAPNPTGTGVSGPDTAVTINSVTYQAMKIERGTYADKGGTATIQFISNLTGSSSSYDITSEAKAAVKTFTLSAPTDIVAEGETPEIPFTAVDQYGNAVTKYDDLNTKVQLSSNLSLQQKADGTAKVVFSAPPQGAETNIDLPVYLTSVVTDGGNFSSVMVNVKDAAVPTSIAGVDTVTTPVVSTTIAQGGSQTIKAQDLVVQDQYGRTLTDAKVNTWMNTVANSAIIVDSSASANSPFRVTSTANGSDAARQTISTATESFTVTGKPGANLEGSENLVFSLSNTSVVAPISGSSKSITFTLGVQSEYASYEVADLGTVYNNGDPANNTGSGSKTLKVYGVRADGSKALLPVAQYKATTTGKLDIDGNGVITDKTSGGYADTEFQTSTSDTGYSKVLDVPVAIQVYNGNTGTAAAVVNTTLKVSHAPRKVVSAAFNTNVVTDGAAFLEAPSISALQLNSVFDTTKVLDQYGDVISENPIITITNLVKVTGSGFTATNSGANNATIANATAGDKFTATYTYASGVTATVNFTVTGNDITAPTATATPSTSTGAYMNAAELTAGVPFTAGIGGSGAVAGDSLEILVAGVPVASHVLVNADLITPYVFNLYADSFGADGLKSITTRVVDIAGNVGAQSAAISVTKDTVAPSSFTITNPLVTGTAQGGVTFTDSTTTTADTIAFAAGSFATTDTVTFKLASAGAITLTVAADGSVTAAGIGDNHGALSEAARTAVLTITDAAGNVTTQNIIIDGTTSGTLV